MTKIIKKILCYWNQPLHEPDAEELVNLDAVRQLVAVLEALELETGQSIVCDLPGTYCVF